MPDPSPRSSKLALFFAVIAVMAGAMSCVQGSVGGRSVGWEAIMIYAAPAVVGAVIAIAIERSRVTYLAVIFGILGIIGLLLAM